MQKCIRGYPLGGNLFERSELILLESTERKGTITPQQTTNTMKNKKVLTRHEKIDLAIEAMHKTTSQFYDAGVGLSIKDVGQLTVSYDDRNHRLCFSAKYLDDGWDLSFNDFAKQIIEGITIDSDDDYDEIVDYSRLLISGFRKVASQIEREVKKFLDEEGKS